MSQIVDRQLDITRRRFLAGSAMAGFAAFIAACGTSGTGNKTAAPTTAGETTGPEATTAATEAPVVEATPSAELNWANWCCYLDVDPNDDTKWKTLEDFQAKYGTVVNYQEVIDENEGFVASISNQITAGQDPGWDIIVV